MEIFYYYLYLALRPLAYCDAVDISKLFTVKYVHIEVPDIEQRLERISALILN